MASRKALDTFFTVTPCCCTSGGSRGMAMLTRFCVCTVAMSGLVPSLNVTCMFSVPSLALVER